MKRLDQIHLAYTRMKIALRDDPHVPDTGLSMISDNLPNELRQIYDPAAKVSNTDELKAIEGNMLKDKEGKTIGHRRKQIRQKFYGQEGITQRDQAVSIIVPGLLIRRFERLSGALLYISAN